MRYIVIVVLVFSLFSCKKSENISKLKCIDEKLNILGKRNSVNVFFVYSHNCELCTIKVIDNCYKIIQNSKDEDFVFVFSASDSLLHTHKELIDNNRIKVYSNKMYELDSCGLLAAESIYVKCKNDFIVKWEKL